MTQIDLETYLAKKPITICPPHEANNYDEANDEMIVVDIADDYEAKQIASNVLKYGN
jgi:hypothetical protein